MTVDGGHPRDPGLVVLERGGIPESLHRVHVAVVGAAGEPVGGCGNLEFPTYLRSAAKPFQVMPLLEGGAADAFGLTDEEIALCCGSHNGEPEHLKGVRSMLERGALSEEDLICGAHAPMLSQEARRLTETGQLPERIHNNCSGKHAGMLLLARARGWPTVGYERAEHPVQVRMQVEIARWLGVQPQSMGTGIDGCGVVCFVAPLVALARGYQALGAAWVAGEAGPKRVADAMIRYPHRVAGTGRLCTAVLGEYGGRVLVKVGAEGVYAGCMRRPGGQILGFAIKVEDGGRRAVEVALLDVLASLGEPLPPALEKAGFGHPSAVRNTLGDPVAWLHARIPLQKEGSSEDFGSGGRGAVA